MCAIDPETPLQAARALARQAGNEWDSEKGGVFVFAAFFAALSRFKSCNVGYDLGGNLGN